MTVDAHVHVGKSARAQIAAAALSKVLHAPIPVSAREKILGGNLRRLLGES